MNSEGIFMKVYNINLSFINIFPSFFEGINAIIGFFDNDNVFNADNNSSFVGVIF